MRLSKIFIVFCSCMVVACQHVKQTPKPKNLIPEHKMVNVLVDLAKIDAAISLNANEYEKRGVVGKDLIFKKYGIDSMQLVKSNRYYAEHFKQNQRIYQNVRAKLKQEEDSLRQRDKKGKPKRKNLKGLERKDR